MTGDNFAAAAPALEGPVGLEVLIFGFSRRYDVKSHSVTRNVTPDIFKMENFTQPLSKRRFRSQG